MGTTLGGPRRRIHLLGIGGAGMSSLALLLQNEGHLVSGSDARASHVTESLEAAGIAVDLDESTLPAGIERLVLSSAIGPEHPLLQEGAARGLEIVHRSAELSRLFNASRGVAVAGSHGKTTTSSMLTHVLAACGESPSAMIGGKLVGYEQAFLGDGPFVTEADESDGSLLAYRPLHAVITSVDDDVNVTAQAYAECGYHRRSVQETVDSVFQQFARGCQKSLWICHEHARASALFGDWPGIKTYGVDGCCTLRAETIERGPLHTVVKVILKGRPLGVMRVPLPGHHNVLNSLAATGLALDLGLRFADIAHAIAMFAGVERRFQLLGRKQGAICIDDYAHNPQKVTAALQAALQASRGRVIALFQPHRYTRMRLLGQDFLPALDGADQVLLTDVYSSGEEPNGFEIGNFHQQLLERSPAATVHWTPAKESVFRTLDKIVRPGDIVISLGAGDCGAWLAEWLEQPRQESSEAAELAA